MGAYTPLTTGIILFLSIFLTGTTVIYASGPMWEKQPFVQHFFSSSPWTGGYYEFWGFVWWLVIVPILIFALLFYPAGKVGKSRRGFHR